LPVSAFPSFWHPAAEVARVLSERVHLIQKFTE